MSERQPTPTFDAAIVSALMVAGRQVSEVLCDRWTLLLLLSAHAGLSRFSDFRARWGISNRMLGTRLEMLEQQEILVRLAYSRRPLRYSYHLSHMGLALFDVFVAMLEWEHRFMSAAGGVQLEHLGCGTAPVRASSHCRHCHASVETREIDITAVSGLAAAMPERTSTYRRSGPRGREDDVNDAGPLPGILGIYGDKWTIEIIMCAFTRVSTFRDIQRFTGMSTNILSDRLARLVATDVLFQERVEADARRLAYKLTARGRGLLPVIMSMWAWADTWLKNRVRAPFLVRHRICGEPLRMEFRCNGCELPLARERCRLVLL